MPHVASSDAVLLGQTQLFHEEHRPRGLWSRVEEDDPALPEDDSDAT